MGKSATLPIIIPIISIVFILGIVVYLLRSRSDFKEINKRQIITRKPLLNAKNTEPITRGFLEDLLKEVIHNGSYANGPPMGANVTFQQNNYDLIFKDFVITSEKRDFLKYPNPNNYTIILDQTLQKIYKAELIEVYIPAATDDSINIPTTAQRLYFSYKYTDLCVKPGEPDTRYTTGYILIQAGTYQSPMQIAEELTRQFDAILKAAGFDVSDDIGVTVYYSTNMNRYIFQDRNYSIHDQYLLPTLIIYPENGYVIDMDNTVQDSITGLLMLNYSNDSITIPYKSGPKYINSTPDGVLYVDVATPGDFGEYEGNNMPLNIDCLYSNCIISDVVLTNCKIFLSIDKLNGTTVNMIPDQSGRNMNLPPVFCQVPNNTSISSSSVKTLLNQPNNYSSIQFYNPVLSKINKLNIRWYDEYAKPLRLLDHCFTIRIHYFQKRFDTTDFSYEVV